MKIYQGGYTGRVLRIDLTKGKYRESTLPKEIALNFIGGRGFSSKIQYDNTGPSTDPLGEENVVVIATGPLNGTIVPSSSRFTIGAKSPLTGILGDSNCGGSWAPELKFAGYDLIIISGRAHSPVYVWINDNTVEIRDAKDIWGKNVYETDDIIKEEVGDPDAKVLEIGPAGENLVKYASAVTEGYNFAGRTGMGAVLGSKNLKAIAVKGSGDIEIAHIDRLRRTVDDIIDIFADDITTIDARRLGTLTWLEMLNDASGGGGGARNFQLGWFDKAENITGSLIREKYKIKSRACFSCLHHCRQSIMLSEGPFKGTYIPKIEFYSVVSFSSKCDNANLEAALKACELCDKYGLDQGSAGACIALAMECYEKGLITMEDTEGLPLDWGNYETILKLVEMIAMRRGFGAFLAEGERYLVTKIKGAERFATDIKGLSFPAGEPRSNEIYTFRYVIASRGGDHLRAQGCCINDFVDMPFQKGMERLMFFEICCQLCDMMGVCKFPYVTFTESFEGVERKALDGLTQMFSVTTGFRMNKNQMITAAERLINLERAYLVRHGIRRKDDVMPRRFREEPLPRGPWKGKTYEHLDLMLNIYYKSRGWDIETGIPTQPKLKELGLLKVAEDLRRIKKSSKC